LARYKIGAFSMGIKGAFLWRVAVEKVSASAYMSILIAFITHLLEEGKSPEEINTILKKSGYVVAEKLIMEYMEREPFPENLKDFAKATNLWMKMFAGKDFDKIFIDVEEDGKKVRIHMIVRDNPLTKNIEAPNPDLKLDNLLAGIFEAAARMGADYMEETKVGIKKLSCEEVRCISAGSDACEFVLEIELSDEGARKVKEKLKLGRNTIR